MSITFSALRSRDILTNRSDIDYHHDEVIADVKNWGVWITKEVGLKGFRLDAVQHFSERFTSDWVETVRKECGDDMFFVGEYWTGNTQELLDWLAIMDHKFSLFDSPLLYSFSRISTSEAADLRGVFDNSLVKAEPYNAVTVVMNHDTQPGQTVATPVERYFKPLAYALILLRGQGYPSVFWGDLYGLLGRGDDAPKEDPIAKLPDIILARALYAYGDQNDYFEEANCIGWVRRGTWDKPAGCAVVISNAGPGERRMCVGDLHRGQIWTDVLGWSDREVEIDHDGWGTFPVGGTSLSIFVRRDAEGRDRFPVQFDTNIYS